MRIGAYVPQAFASANRSSRPLAGAQLRAPLLARYTSKGPRGDDLGILFGRLNNSVDESALRPATAPQAARLQIAGGAGALATTSVTLAVQGNRKGLLLQIEKGQSLGDVAQQINNQSRATRIVAEVSGNNLVVSSLDTGRKARLRVEQLSPGEPIVQGVDSEQVSRVSVLSPSSSSEKLSGSVLSVAQQASLRYVGETGGLVAADATFVLHGADGTTTVQITAGELLAAVADRINQNTSATGVSAAIEGDDLIFRSEGAGSDATVRVELIVADYDAVTSGTNATQVALLEVTAMDPGSESVLSGSVTRSATQAELTLHGATGSVVATGATFDLQGSLGTRAITITAGESLADVATRVNALTSNTGVSATVSGNDLIFRSSGIGSSATISTELTAIQHDSITSGADSQQVTGFQVLSFTDGATQTLAGTLTRAATQAELTLRGATGGVVVDGATFRLQGSVGNATISIVDGEALSAVASRVNALTGSTGVTATVSGNDLIFRSTGVGSAATVAAELLTVDHHTSFSGVNAQQVTGFQVQSFTTGATNVLNGSITQAAGKAQLTFAGNALGLVDRNATFTLAGNTGSASFAVTRLETLQSLADRVNAATATTGVRAAVQGNNVVFTSIGVGSASKVEIDATIGLFPVSGGNGSGLAFGTNAAATINGQAITAGGNGNQFSFSDALGSYSFTAVQGFTGAISPITVQSTAGEFNVTGGNGDGTAAGLNAQATINGQVYTAGGNGNQFSFSDALGSYSFNAVQGFTGALATITVESRPRNFDLTGGNGDGTAAGLDALATVNGISLTGTANRFTINGADGQFQLTFQSGFTGAFDPLTIRSEVDFHVVGGNGDGGARGHAAVAVINGKRLVESNGGFTIEAGNGAFRIEFADGFTGNFDSITITPDPNALQVSGGQLGTWIRGSEAGEGTPSDPSSPATTSFSLAQLASRRLRSLVQTNSQALLETLSTGSSSSIQRRAIIGALLQ